MPIRIQRQRTRGWRMPPRAVGVGRPSRWGNPFRIGDEVWVTDQPALRWTIDRGWAIGLFRQWIFQKLRDHPAFLDPLRGKDLACWCPLDQPCHADVLLELANAI